MTQQFGRRLGEGRKYALVSSREGREEPEETFSLSFLRTLRIILLAIILSVFFLRVN